MTYQVKHEKTKCLVGHLQMALRPEQSYLEIAKWKGPPSPLCPPADDESEWTVDVEKVFCRVDQKNGIVWVRRSADLHGVNGYTPL